MPKHTVSELERIEFRSSKWRAVMGRNAKRLNDALLKVDAMLDVDLDSLSNMDILQWNATEGKFQNVSFYSVFPTTTTV